MESNSGCQSNLIATSGAEVTIKKIELNTRYSLQYSTVLQIFIDMDIIFYIIKSYIHIIIMINNLQIPKTTSSNVK